MVQESKDTYFEKGECWCCNGESDWGKLIAVKIPKERQLLFGQQKFVFVCPKCYMEAGKNE